jgi:putative spermidine/putrescine transport system ATP-binding protein
MAFLQLKSLIKSFGPVRVVQEFNLDVARGEFVSLLGPSGCGKTTVLRMVAGFESPTSGQIIIDGSDVTGLRPSQRNVGLVFQSYALFPNLTVAGNIAFGLKVARKPAAETEARVKDMLKLIGLPELGERYPFELSGGQQQRVALARALAVRPRVLLLDEPLSALDAKIRVSLRDQIRDIQRELGITTIFVTHDQEEALSISDRVVVMNKGRADQIGSPHEIYNKPTTEFVANFVGTLNAFSAMVKDAKKGVIMVNDTPITVPQLKGKTLASGGQVKFGLRPEALHLGKQAAPAANLPATVEDVHFLGSVIRLRVRLGDQVMALDTFNRSTEKPPVVGGKTVISFDPTDLILIQ